MTCNIKTQRRASTIPWPDFNHVAGVTSPIPGAVPYLANHSMTVKNVTFLTYSFWTSREDWRTSVSACPTTFQPHVAMVQLKLYILPDACD